MAFEVSREYLAASAFRFIDSGVSEGAMLNLYREMLAGETIDATAFVRQPMLLEAAGPLKVRAAH
jgi:hypothetical protein